MAKTPLNPEEIAIAAKLKDAFNRRKAEDRWTQEDFAQEVGSSQAMVWKWLNGKDRVSSDKAPLVASALGFTDPAEVSLSYRENMLHYGGKGGRMETEEALKARVDALQTIIVALIGATAAHRPAEGRDVAESLQRLATPAARKLPFVREMLAVLGPDAAASSTPASGHPRRSKR